MSPLRWHHVAWMSSTWHHPKTSTLEYLKGMHENFSWVSKCWADVVVVRDNTPQLVRNWSKNAVVVPTGRSHPGPWTSKGSERAQGGCSRLTKLWANVAMYISDPTTNEKGSEWGPTRTHNPIIECGGDKNQGLNHKWKDVVHACIVTEGPKNV